MWLLFSVLLSGRGGVQCVSPFCHSSAYLIGVELCFFLSASLESIDLSLFCRYLSVCVCVFVDFGWGVLTVFSGLLVGPLRSVVGRVGLVPLFVVYPPPCQGDWRYAVFIQEKVFVICLFQDVSSETCSVCALTYEVALYWGRCNRRE